MANKKTITVPLTFEDIPLRCIAVWDELQYEDIRLVHIFSGMKTGELRELPQSAVEKTAEHLRKILSSPTQVEPDRLKIDGVEYGFITDWSNLTSGEYVDICQYVEDPLKNATKIMAILFRPIIEDWGDGYKIKAYNGTNNHRAFNEVSASYLYGAISFFLSTMISSAITSLQSLESQVENLKRTKMKK